MSRAIRRSGGSGGGLVWKLVLDSVMTLLVIAEFAYDVTGSIVHEVIGLVLLVLFVVHLLINRQWFMTFFKGRQNMRRAANSGINLLVLGVALTLLGSGLLNASLIEMLAHFRWSFSTRGVHSLAGYWFLLAMAVHLGMHWGVVLGECRRRLGMVGRAHGIEVLVLRVAAVLCVMGGGTAAVHQELWSRLLADYSFGYWDGGAVLHDFADFAAMVAGMAVLAHYLKGRLPAAGR